MTDVLENFSLHIQNRFWNPSVLLFEGMVLRLNSLFEEMSVVAISEICHTWDGKRLLRLKRGHRKPEGHSK